MKRGEVRWYRFSSPDKRRPVLILTRGGVISWMNEVTVAPVTSTVRGIPSEVLLGRADGMPRECAVNCDHIQTVAKNRLGKVITALGREKLSELSRAVRFALDV
jgi:mRNA interferase MazF